mmetsp:Transcript_89799/g.187680  ORF Transcript_89799/g.187680 Transcript_89799/m.187680 type:complete len:259 (-) Transcript_89799:928-1704(-)
MVVTSVKRVARSSSELSFIGIGGSCSSPSVREYLAATCRTGMISSGTTAKGSALATLSCSRETWASSSDSSLRRRLAVDSRCSYCFVTAASCFSDMDPPLPPLPLLPRLSNDRLLPSSPYCRRCLRKSTVTESSSSSTSACSCSNLGICWWRSIKMRRDCLFSSKDSSFGASQEIQATSWLANWVKRCSECTKACWRRRTCRRASRMALLQFFWCLSSSSYSVMQDTILSCWFVSKPEEMRCTVFRAFSVVLAILGHS